MVSEQGYGEDRGSGWSSGLHPVLLALLAGRLDAHAVPVGLVPRDEDVPTS